MKDKTKKSDVMMELLIPESKLSKLLKHIKLEKMDLAKLDEKQKKANKDLEKIMQIELV